MASVSPMRGSDGAAEPERVQATADASDGTGDPHRPLLRPGASAFGLSLIAHALIIGAVIWLAGIPKIPAPEKPIRVSLLASGAFGSARESASHPRAAARIPTPAHREIETVRPHRKAEISHPRKVTRARVISHRAEPAVAAVAPARATEHPAKNTAGAGVAASGRLPVGAGEGASGIGFSNSGPVPAGSVAHPPRILERVMPHYPIRARVRGITGRVVVEVVLGRDGRIRRIRVVHPVTLLDQAAVRAVSQWRFSPARNANGTPVSVIVDIPVVFRLDD
jgi:protein TonB